MRAGITIFLLIVSSVSIADVISRDPSFLDRGLENQKRMKLGVFNSHSYQIVEDPTGSAPTSLVERFEARHGDCDERQHGESITTDCNSGRTRTEVEPRKDILRNKWSKIPAREFWFGWSIFIPEDFDATSELVIPYVGQFWLGDKGESGIPPLVSFRISGDALRANGSPIAEGSSLKNRWHKIETHIRWSTSSDGFVRVYGNGKLVFERANTITAVRDRMSFKYGIYRTKDFVHHYPADFKYPTQVILYSNVKISNDRAGLAP